MKPIAVFAFTLLALGCGPSNRGEPQPPPAATAGGGVAKGGEVMPFVRVAELEIHAAHLEAYTAAVREEMDTSVRVEPGVLAIYSVAERDSPTTLRFFEVYADEAAYKAHVESPHFRKYVEVTGPMIKSRKLIDAVPVQLSAKPK